MRKPVLDRTESRLVAQKRSTASKPCSSPRSRSSPMARASISLDEIFRSSMRSSSFLRIPLGRSPNVGPDPGGSSSIRRMIPIRKPLLLVMRAMLASQNLSTTQSAISKLRSFSVSMHRSSKSRSTICPDSNNRSNLRAMLDGSPRSGTRQGDFERRLIGERDRERLRIGDRDGERLRIGDLFLLTGERESLRIGEREYLRTGEREYLRTGERERLLTGDREPLTGERERDLLTGERERILLTGERERTLLTGERERDLRTGERERGRELRLAGENDARLAGEALPGSICGKQLQAGLKGMCGRGTHFELLK
mmetsp:Transcript_6985/g.9448  ORF Transcript_6985/g.9448 Transcript_6985/m.9448 type:complete len:312 (+) Transcript_6985:293-1228(+)